MLQWKQLLAKYFICDLFVVEQLNGMQMKNAFKDEYGIIHVLKTQ